MGISQLHGIFFLTKNDNPFYSPRGSLCHKYQSNMPSVICNCKSISKTALKETEVSLLINQLIQCLRPQQMHPTSHPTFWFECWMNVG